MQLFARLGIKPEERQEHADEVRRQPSSRR